VSRLGLCRHVRWSVICCQGGCLEDLPENVLPEEYLAHYLQVDGLYLVDIPGLMVPCQVACPRGGAPLRLGATFFGSYGDLIVGNC